MRVDGAPVERLLDVADRPLVSVFLPDRLELVKGPPALRRAHLDQFVAALWPARVGTRRAYAQALAQRNALIARIRAGRGSRDSLATWDAQLARHGFALMDDRRQAVEAHERVVSPARRRARARWRPGGRLPTRGREPPTQPSSRPSWRSVSTATSNVASPATARTATISRTLREGRELRTYGSQGQQRLALLALLLGERETIAACAQLAAADAARRRDERTRRRPGARRWSSCCARGGGQSVITTTDLDHVPGARRRGRCAPGISAGRMLQDALAA